MPSKVTTAKWETDALKDAIRKHQVKHNPDGKPMELIWRVAVGGPKSDSTDERPMPITQPDTLKVAVANPKDATAANALVTGLSRRNLGEAKEELVTHTIHLAGDDELELLRVVHHPKGKGPEGLTDVGTCLGIRKSCKRAQIAEAWNAVTDALNEVATAKNGEGE